MFSRILVSKHTMKVLDVISIVFCVSTFMILNADKSSAASATALPCNSSNHLRVSFPQLFGHCSDCVYGVWSDKRYTGVLRNNTACPSNKARQFKRTRSARGSNCHDTVEITYECEPTVREKARLIITALRLGADANGGTTNPPRTYPPRTYPPRTYPPRTNPPRTYPPRTYPPRTNPPRTIPPRTYPPRTYPPRTYPPWTFPTQTIPPRTNPTSCPTCYIVLKNISISRFDRQVYRNCPSPLRQQNNRVCLNMCLSRGKRLAEDINEVIDSAIEPMNPSVPVQQFDLDEHLSQIAHSARVRRQACGQTRYVLFIVDTSGSIGKDVFDSVKRVVADLSETLCDYLKVAMITYSSDINLEFCFNCNNNNRRDIKNAILRARYRGGGTSTTDAIKCACNQTLTSQCGLPQSGIYTPNIDVVLLTDGRHNGPCRNNLDNELRCLHGKSNINTFGIGIGSVDHQSVVKLTKGNGDHIFRVNNFEELQILLQTIKMLLDVKGRDGKPVYDCAGHHASCHG